MEFNFKVVLRSKIESISHNTRVLISESREVLKSKISGVNRVNWPLIQTDWFSYLSFELFELF